MHPFGILMQKPTLYPFIRLTINASAQIKMQIKENNYSSE